MGHLFQGRFPAVVVEKETPWLAQCRHVVLKLVRAKAVAHPRQWIWIRYRATVGEGEVLGWLTVDGRLKQVGSRCSDVQERYRRFGAAGGGGSRPWKSLPGQIDRGAADCIARHQPEREIRRFRGVRPRRCDRPCRSCFHRSRRGAPESQGASAPWGSACRERGPCGHARCDRASPPHAG